MTPDTPDFDAPLEQYRSYLHLLARLRIEPALRRRIDPSDLVQQTLIEAHRAAAKWIDRDEAERRAFLRTIMVHNLADAVRKLRAARGAIALEVYPDEIDSSSARLDQLAVLCSTASKKAAQQEALLELARALDRLPAEQRTAIELKHLHGMSVADIAERMGRTESAVGGLLRRGLQKLRQLCEDPQ